MGKGGRGSGFCYNLIFRFRFGVVVMSFFQGVVGWVRLMLWVFVVVYCEVGFFAMFSRFVEKYTWP